MEGIAGIEGMVTGAGMVGAGMFAGGSVMSGLAAGPIGPFIFSKPETLLVRLERSSGCAT
jgi:hypothetical protein